MKVIYGTGGRQPRFRSCVSHATGYMGLAVGHMFVNEFFDEMAMKEAKDMISRLKVAFSELLDENSWMDGKTRLVAREKNEYIVEEIGYPKEINNVTFLDILYENYTFNSENYFNNVLVYIRQSAMESLRSLREPVNKRLWRSPPTLVNAMYSALKNQIQFPAGILQPPFFNNTYPRSMNFGGIGVVIGHEITHGFDDRGRQYDKNGNLNQWWSDGAISRFKQQTQCIVQQYGNYSIPEAEMNVDGVMTQGENIADNGGLKQSFRAYRSWVENERKGVEEKPLPGLNFTHNQLFFLNFAQIWCSNMRKEGAINKILTGVHSPKQFRVIGTLQNSHDFSQAFGCPHGTSYMNPSRKCFVW